MLEKLKNSKISLTELVKWCASAILVVAGVLIALKISVQHVYVSYFMFAVGHVIWISLFALKKEYSYVMANGAFLIIDLIGIYNWINL